MLLAGTRWRLQPLAAAAAGAGAYTVVYDVVFNRQVIGDIGQFFTTSEDFTELVEKMEVEPTRSAPVNCSS